MTDEPQPLRAAGFFADLSYGYQEEPALVTSVRPAGEDWEAQAVGYLGGGTVIAAAMMVTSDILDPADPIIGPLTILADGVWMWPSDLAYYVQRYHCAVPPDFVQHMREQDWTPPTDL